MSLPDAPNTLREKYYSVMAGQNDADILPDIETAPSTENRYLDFIARNGGGGGSSVEVTQIKTSGEKIATITVDNVPTDLYASAGGGGGDVTKEYVDTAIANAVAGTEPLIFFGTLAEWNALTDAEKAKYRTLKIPDTRVSDIEALIPSTASSSNKLATASDVAAKQSQITQSSLLTLTVAGWDSTTLQQTVAFVHDTTKRNVIDVTLGEMTTWGECGVRAVSETAAGITFECDTVPETALTFKVTSMEVG